MWDSKKSLTLSVICTRVVIVLVAIFAPLVTLQIFMPIFVFTDGDIEKLFYILLLILFYICCALAFVALFSLNHLLTNIKAEIIFEEINVSVLRRISWCCFIVAILLLIGSLVSGKILMMLSEIMMLSYILFGISVMAGFMGLILRVVKNVFQAAVELKAENDYTI